MCRYVSDDTNGREDGDRDEELHESESGNPSCSCKHNRKGEMIKKPGYCSLFGGGSQGEIKKNQYIPYNTRKIFQKSFDLCSISYIL